MTYQKNLSKVQSEIDVLTEKYIEDDFNLKLEFHKKLTPILAERDSMLRNLTKEEYHAFLENAVQSFPAFLEFLPVKHDNTVDVSFIKFFKAEYLEEFKMKITLELYENDYIENEVLEKTLFVTDENPVLAKVIWKNEKGNCPLFDFFESDEDDFEAFDILYELYVDQVFFSTLAEEEQ